jgi:hypothetical protein
MIRFRTVSDRRIDLSAPDPADVDVQDIACALGNLCRFTGQVRDFYSVAQHACTVARLLPRTLRYAGLHHDDSEAYLNDMTRHLKHSPALEGFRYFEAIWTAAIEEALGITLVPEDRQVIKAADDVVAVYEQFVIRYRRTWDLAFIDQALDEGFISERAPKALLKELAHHLPRHHQAWAPREAEHWFLQDHREFKRRA